MNFGRQYPRYGRQGFGRSGNSGYSFGEVTRDSARGGTPTLSITDKARQRKQRNAMLYDYDHPRNAGSGGGGAGEGGGKGGNSAAGGGESQKFGEIKDGYEESKKEKEKMKEYKRGAPTVPEVRKHIKYLIQVHEKEVKESNSTIYPLISKDQGQNGEGSGDVYEHRQMDDWSAPYPVKVDIFGNTGPGGAGQRKKQMSKKRGPVKRKDL